MKSLTHVATRFINCPLMIHPPKLEVMIRAIGPRLGIDPEAALAHRIPLDATATLMSRYMEAGEERDYAVVDGIALIPVQGTLIKKDTWMSAWSGCTSYERIQDQIAAAVNDGGVRAILLDIDSPGGETAGCFDLADFIYSARASKPIYAAANDIALSAAYAIASSASRIYVTRTGAVGSIGVYALHVDQSSFDKQIGARFTYVFAGAKKIDGNPHEPLGEGAKDDIQSEVDREYGMFTETVARNRKANQKEIIATQAGLFWADNAIPLLADEVGTLDDAMNALRVALGEPTVKSSAAAAAIQPKGEHMTKETQLLAANKKGEVDDMEDKKGKKETEEPDANKSKGSEPKDEDETEDEPDGDEPETEGKKKGAALTPGPMAASRSESDIAAIGAMCKLAGCPEKAPEFLTMKKSSGQYFSVADVSEALTNARVEESEKRMISSHVDPNKGAAGNLQAVEAEAAAFARQNQSQATPGLYVTGVITKVTKERAYAQAIEAHPEVYESYRNQHNAADLVRRLQSAGFELVQR